jgi:hypothetical protein
MDGSMLQAITKGATMFDLHKMAVLLLVLCNTAATMVTLSNAQEPAISERERRGLAECLTKCPDGDMKCNNRCISQFQTRGAWSDRAFACTGAAMAAASSAATGAGSLRAPTSNLTKLNTKS